VNNMDTTARNVWLKSLKPGDRVAIKNHGRPIEEAGYQILEIAHITKTRNRFDLVNPGDTYVLYKGNARGYIKGSGFSGGRDIEPVTDEVRVINRRIKSYRRFTRALEDASRQGRQHYDESFMDAITEALKTRVMPASPSAE